MIIAIYSHTLYLYSNTAEFWDTQKQTIAVSTEESSTHMLKLELDDLKTRHCKCYTCIATYYLK